MDRSPPHPANRFPWVIPERCEGCADCVSQCPAGCLSMHESGHPGALVPWMHDPAACTACGRCEEVCVWGGIGLTAHVAEAIARMTMRRPGKRAAV